MNLNQILNTIRLNYDDETINFLAEKMIKGDLSVRKQLADKITAKTAKVSPKIILEIAKWGINDDLSQCSKIKALSRK